MYHLLSAVALTTFWAQLVKIQAKQVLLDQVESRLCWKLDKHLFTF